MKPVFSSEPTYNKVFKETLQALLKLNVYSIPWHVLFSVRIVGFALYNLMQSTVLHELYSVTCRTVYCAVYSAEFVI